MRTHIAVRLVALSLASFTGTAMANNADQASATVKNSTEAHPIGADHRQSTADHNPAKDQAGQPVSHGPITHGKLSVDNTQKGHPVGANENK